MDQLIKTIHHGKEEFKWIKRRSRGSYYRSELASMIKVEDMTSRREIINFSFLSMMRLVGVGVGVGAVGTMGPGAAFGATTGNPWETSPIQTSPVLEKFRKLEQTEKVRSRNANHPPSTLSSPNPHRPPRIC